MVLILVICFKKMHLKIPDHKLNYLGFFLFVCFCFFCLNKITYLKRKHWQSATLKNPAAVWYSGGFITVRLQV